MGQLSLDLGQGAANTQPESQHRAWRGMGPVVGGRGSLCTGRTPQAPGPQVGGMETSCKAWEEAGGRYPDWQDGPAERLWLEVP